MAGLKWSEQDLANHVKGRMFPVLTGDTKIPAFGVLKTDPRMNKLEARYDAYLWSMRGHLYVWHAFEAIKLRLADNTFYTPDFLVQTTSGQIEMQETKGFWRDDARVKIKVAAALYPFRFLAITENKSGGWKVEEF